MKASSTALLQLETETKAWLQPFLFKHRVELSSPNIRPFVDQAVDLYAARGWQALMQAAQPVIGDRSLGGKRTARSGGGFTEAHRGAAAASSSGAVRLTPNPAIER